MANVHSLKDIPDKHNQNRSNGTAHDSSINSNYMENQLPFIATLKSDRWPVQQTIPYTLKMVLCPDFKLCSTASFFLALMWLVYFASLSRGINTQNKQVLQISYDLLISFGGAVGSKVSQGQLYRLVAASFIHTDLLHIITSSFFLLYLCTRFEKIYPKETPFILLVSAISGLLLGVVYQRQLLIVGASTSIFGLLGGFVAYLVINWTTLEAYKQARTSIVCAVCFIIFISMLFSMGRMIDAIAHLGGLIGGLFISLALLKGISGNDKRCTYIGLVGTIGMSSICLLLLLWGG